MPQTLDKFDLRLLDLLQQDCRRTADQLSEHLGLSPAAVQKRLKKLRDTGVVEAEIALVNPESVGRNMTIIVEVSMERENLAVLDSFKRRMRAEPLVQQCYYTTGEADFTLILVVKDIEEYRRFTQENFFGTPEVGKFKTSIVMDRVKVGLSVSLEGCPPPRGGGVAIWTVAAEWGLLSSTPAATGPAGEADGAESMVELERRIAAGRGDEPADQVLRGGTVFDVVTGAMIAGDVAIVGDTIVGLGADYEGREVIDVAGLTLVPGFIDTHLHIESSLVTPFEFDRCVAPRGVTTAICDPHEIANVIGPDGIRYFQDASRRTVMDIRVQLSSCVPSTHMETAGARIEANDLTPLMGHESGIGLAEFMNYPGVIHRDPGAMAKLRLFEGGHVDGHCPQLSGRDLNAYIAAGIRTEHEATTAEEALEKLRKGMRVLIREGSVSKDLEALAPVLTEATSAYLCLCTDDRNPLDIAEHGHLDYMIRRLIAKGCSPLAVYRAASLSAAEAFGLRDRGQIAPGKRADIVAVDSLEGCHARLVLCGGRVVNDAAFAARKVTQPVGRNSVRAPKVAPEDFRAAGNRAETDVIGILEGKIITEHLREDIPLTDGDKRPDTARDLIRIAVVERHGRNGNIATGFVKGFGLKAGAIASTVCHDHHNIAVVGADYADMALAANRLSEIEGGFVVTKGGKVLAELALPVAGLMSLDPFEAVRDRLVVLRDAAKSLGVVLEEPFLQLAFLALPVIPALKITDRGMVDVTRFEIIPG